MYCLFFFAEFILIFFKKTQFRLFLSALDYKLILNVITPMTQHCDDDEKGCQASMRVTDAWKAGYHGENVVITILDDGIESTHPDLRANYVSSDVVIIKFIFNISFINTCA